MMGDPLLWAASAALIIWVGFYRPWDRAAVVIGAPGYRGPASVTSGVVLADWKAGSSRTRAAISSTDPAPRRTE